MSKWHSPCAVISPTLSFLHDTRSRQVERPVGERSAGISGEDKRRTGKIDPAESQGAASFKFLLESFPLAQRLALSASRDGHILEDTPIPLDPECHDLLSHLLAILPFELTSHQTGTRSENSALARWNARWEP